MEITVDPPPGNGLRLYSDRYRHRLYRYRYMYNSSRVCEAADMRRGGKEGGGAPGPYAYVPGVRRGGWEG